MSRTFKRVSALVLAIAMIACAIPMMHDDAYAAKKTKKPAKVKNVKAKVKAKKVTIKWKKVKNAKKYEIQIKDNGTKLVATKKVNKTKYSFKGKADSKYTIRIRGLKGKQKGKWSKKAKVVIPADEKSGSSEAQKAAEDKAKAAEEAKAKAEADKKASDDAKAQAEADKKSAEEAKAKAEADQKEAEKKLADAEKAQKDAEQKALDAEAAKEQAEQDKAASDAEKEAAEQAAAQANEEKEQALADKEAAEKEAADAKAILDVTNIALALPDESELTYQDREAVREAATALNEMTDEQRAQVSDALINKINAEKAKVDEMQEIVEGIKAVNAPNYKTKISIDNGNYYVVKKDTENNRALLLYADNSAEYPFVEEERYNSNWNELNITSMEAWKQAGNESLNSWKYSYVRSFLNGELLTTHSTIKAMALSTDIKSTVARQFRIDDQDPIVEAEEITTTDKVFLLASKDILQMSTFSETPFISVTYEGLDIPIKQGGNSFFRDTYWDLIVTTSDSGNEYSESSFWVQNTSAGATPVNKTKNYKIKYAFWVELGE